MRKPTERDGGGWGGGGVSKRLWPGITTLYLLILKVGAEVRHSLRVK